MDLEEIKREAKLFQSDDLTLLSEKIRELKNKGISFLGCIAFVQHHKDISLKEACDLTLQLEAYNKDEKEEIDYFHKLMMSEFEEE